MDGWDALQAYDLVNDGGRNYGFTRANRDRGWHFGEAFTCTKMIFSLERKAKKLARQEGLTDPL